MTEVFEVPRAVLIEGLERRAARLRAEWEAEIREAEAELRAHRWAVRRQIHRAAVRA